MGDAKRERLIGCITLGVALLAFMLAGLDRIHDTPDINTYDSAAYLSAAAQARESGGPFGIMVGCFTGAYREANRMPLYIALLSLLPFHGLRVIAYAKLLTLFIGAGAVAITFFAARRWGGWAVAALAGVLLCMNSAHIFFSSFPACESLLAIFLVLLWSNLTKYLETGRRLAWSGVWMGLAYVTKASGIFAAPTVVATALWKERRRFWRSKQAWLALGLFLIIILPMLVRNVRVYDSPFYNVNTAYMWLDRWEDVERPDYDSKSMGMRSYLRTHSFGQIAQRMAKGAFQEGIYVVVSAGESYLLHGIFGLKVWPVGLLLLALAGIPLLDSQSRPGALVALGISAAFFLFFTWYPVKDARFTTPLLPIWLILAARGLEILWKRLCDLRPGLKLRPQQLLISLSLVLAIGTGVAAACQPNLRKSPLDAYREPPGYYELAHWLADHVPPDSGWIMGPSDSYRFDWIPAVPEGQRFLPLVSAIGALDDFIAEQDVRYIVIDAQVIERRPALAPWFEATGEEVALKALPPGWRLAFTPAGMPSPYLVFDVSSVGRK